MDSCLTEAAELLGYRNLKDEQISCLTEFLSGRDVFVILPTGFGKTACFTLLPFAFDKYQKRDSGNKAIIIVVSPLTALIINQVEALLSRNVSAGYINSESTSDVKKNVTLGKYCIVFMGPEQLVDEWRSLLSSDVYMSRLVGLIIDEAHCVVKWGKTFREAFTRLTEVRSTMPSHIGIMALTATATRTLRLQVEQILGMRSPLAIIRSPDKPNLRFSNIELGGVNNYGVPNIFHHILIELREKLTDLQRVMIFCKVKTDCPKLYTFFKACLGRYFTHPPGASTDLVECRLVDMFFKGTRTHVKQRIIENFTKDSCLRIIICTDAFGMGVNCPDVRLVIHYGVPSDVETYVQQIGRSGRDGKESYAVLLHSKKEDGEL
ncbi:PREDICTED: uncharacterized protein LOC100639792 [Amphimedon queenslandica]|uniref:DNA 3'-5' helicase n=1 Tax=Amphimedon queenslandica TaxID=400682 RepID=A0A1X7U239_AMPQE|nr:PREDICTED: uncharacterized protein LOC100639792 [Amphimedon queenslandica]|eukprot:XP_003389188.1 PREDICTED: uncharacterized protein LOC100639792 [Amphimedon queenslandica]